MCFASACVSPPKRASSLPPSHLSQDSVVITHTLHAFIARPLLLSYASWSHFSPNSPHPPSRTASRVISRMPHPCLCCDKCAHLSQSHTHTHTGGGNGVSKAPETLRHGHSLPLSSLLPPSPAPSPPAPANRRHPPEIPATLESFSLAQLSSAACVQERETAQSGAGIYSSLILGGASHLGSSSQERQKRGQSHLVGIARGGDAVSSSSERPRWGPPPPPLDTSRRERLDGGGAASMVFT